MEPNHPIQPNQDDIPTVPVFSIPVPPLGDEDDTLPKVFLPNEKA